MKNSTYSRRKFFFLIVLISLFSSKSYSQLTAKSLTASNGVFIGFYEFKPANYDPSKKYPLIIFMHGIGERGNGTTDLPSILNNGLAANIKNGNQMTFTWNGKTESFVVLMPQLSGNYGSWQNFYTDEMIKYAQANLSYDPNRVYLTGLSLGGGGVWSYAGATLANAQKFAAIGISCGTQQYVNFCNIANANLPTWAMHASNDGTVNYSATVNSINAINNCNPAVKPYMTIWPDGDHWIWGRVYDTAHDWQNPNLYEWFLGQNRTLPVNKRPIANAGADLAITTGTGVVTLNGSASYDTDGKVVRYVWRKIGGPGYGSITNATSDNGVATVSQLWLAGTYVFEVKAIDDRADWSLDTVNVVVSNGGNINTPPTANAGSDISITLPTNSTTLNGTASYDPEGITSYAWSYVSGPSQYTIVSPSLPVTALTNLVAGTYKFKLTVTDNLGVASSATINVNVNSNGVNQPPIANAGSDISITLPTNNTTLNGTASSDPDGTIVSYAWSWVSGPSQYSITNAAAATTTLTNLAQGTYVFKLTVTDNSGASASTTVKVIVNPAPNQPPVANAGSDITITLPTNSTTLNGTASSDPDGTIASYAWAWVSGPSQYSITNASAATTTLTNLAQGTYVFKLTVTDNSGASASTTVKVIVNAAPNQPPVANAGSDISITLPTSNTTLNGTASSDPDGTIASYAWAWVSGPSQYSITNAAAATTTLTNLAQGTYVFKLTVTDNSGASASTTVKVIVNPAPNQPPVANAGSDITITLPTNSTTLNGTASSDPDGTIASYAWAWVSGPSQYSITNAAAATTTLTNLAQGTYVFKLTVTDNSGASSSATVNITVNIASNQVPVANAGSDISITLPTNSTTLNGTASYDPDGTIASYAWAWVSGPSQYSITNASAVTTTLTNLAQGIYVFKLTVTDNSGASASTTVKVIVNAAPNQPPVANAGSDISITLPTNSTTLNGTASSDPDGTIAAYAWSWVSGPSQYSITNASAATTTLTNLAQGTYVFNLTVTDNSGASASTTVKVIVNAAPNQPPVANAGSDISITLPTNSTTLNSTASYDPDGTIASYAWSWVSGPSQYSITNAAAATTTLTNLAQGTYVFKLTVTDNSGASTSTTVKVIVNPAPNQPPVANAGSDITITLPTNSTTLNGTASYDPDGTIASYAWAWVSGPSQYSITNTGAATTTLNNLVQGNYVFKLTVTDNNGASTSATVNVTVNKAPNQAPIANAGSDIVMELPTNSTILNGTASNDPDGTIVSFVWTWVSGPSQYSIANATTATPSLSNLSQGTYVFRLTVTDNEGASSSASVTITVLPPPNKPPVANAGKDTTVVLPNPVITLNATASYDPDGQIVSYSWTRISGPGALTIVNSSTATPTVVGVQIGTYVFELTVTDDKGASAKAQVTVTVLAKPNTQPVANAGKDISIGIPATSAVLDGSKSYDPDGTITAYSWKQIEGPGKATIANAANAITTVSNLQPGIYTFELTVTDNSGATAKDSVQVSLVNNLRNEESLLVYPNPVVSITNMRLRCMSDTLGLTKVTIFDMNGKLLKTFTTYKTQSFLDIAVPVTNLLSGIYYIEVNIDNKKRMLTKFVKQ